MYLYGHAVNKEQNVIICVICKLYMCMYVCTPGVSAMFSIQVIVF